MRLLQFLLTNGLADADRFVLCFRALHQLVCLLLLLVWVNPDMNGGKDRCEIAGCRHT